ncbi:unnamed protein product [Psylliodes chrysocephalus]|uniref:DUF4371 domain-containing protein n=1 Tax=Psylliodes chrysocephalus TaxID=3402493 RepID=A0A9P0GB38_9CUCU|nr:unnamed protein product [Psylliodes chrysocephala]
MAKQSNIISFFKPIHQQIAEPLISEPSTSIQSVTEPIIPIALPSSTAAGSTDGSESESDISENGVIEVVPDVTRRNDSEQSIASILKDTNYSIIVDETTDVSVKKCLAILVRYVDIRLEKVKDRLLALVEVTDVTSEGILQKFLTTIESLSIPHSNLLGFAADNAAVMMGKFNGVQAKLKQINPNIFVMGCICHSLHLCASAASAVVKRTLEQWPALLLYFNAAILEDNLVAASTIHNALNNVIFKLYLTFLAYILPLITKLNLEFQAERPQLYNIHDAIQTTTKTILKIL